MAQTTVFKVTMFFGDGRYGWSETYYTQTVNQSKLAVAPTNPLAVLPQTVTLAAARAAMLPGTVSNCVLLNNGVATKPVLEYIRISTVGAQRVTAFYDPQSSEIVNGVNLAPSITNQPLTTSQVLANDSASNPFTGIEMECQLGNGLISKRILSGIPSQDICDQAWGKSSGWYGLWKNFANILTTAGWGTLSNSPFNNAGLLSGIFQPLLAATTQADGRVLLEWSTAMSFNTLATGCPDWRIMIACYRPVPGGYPRLNGVYRISDPQSTTIGTGSNSQPGFSALTKRVFKPLNTFNLGYIAPFSVGVFTPFVSATLTRTMSRKRGRPFGQSRGRALTVR